MFKTFAVAKIIEWLRKYCRRQNDCIVLSDQHELAHTSPEVTNVSMDPSSTLIKKNFQIEIPPNFKIFPGIQFEELVEGK